MKALDFSNSPLIQKSLARARAQNNELRVIENIAPVQLKTNENPLNLHGIPQNEMTPAIKEAFDSLMQEIKVLRSERVRLLNALKNAESLADTDPLSQVFNQRAFLREMGRVMAFGQRYGIPSCLLFFDLNGFKAINDNFGHAAGDAIIKAFADVLKANIRESDVVGRVGGDEFAILLAKATYEEAQAKANHLKNAIAAISINFNDKILKIGATIGTYAIDNHDNPKSALEQADGAMYAQKISQKISIL